MDFDWDLELSNRASLTYKTSLGQENWSLPIGFEGISPSDTSIESAEGKLERLRAMQMGLRALASQVHWLRALRKVPQRWTSYGRRQDRLESDGTGVPEILVADSLEGGDVLRQVETWFERATGFQFHLLEGAGRDEGDIFSLDVSPRNNRSLRIPIVDTGEGMIQVLPVLVLAAMARVGRLGTSPLLALEHPELHLHPAAHAKLAEVFCEVARSDGPTLLVETHSENLLLQVQLAIARGEIKPEQVLIYWIQQNIVGRSTAEPIEFDELAIPVGYKWPPGVFSEASELARKLSSKRRQLRRS